MKLGGEKKNTEEGKLSSLNALNCGLRDVYKKKTTKKENFWGGTERWDRWLLIQTEKKMPLINEESKKKKQNSSTYVKSYIFYLEYVHFSMTLQMCS